MSSSTFTEAWLDGPDGHHFYTRTYAAPAAPKAVLLFVHGFGDHIGRYESIHPRFAAHGITVFAYDLRGFGRTALDDEHRSPGSAYGKTSRKLELGDLEHWVDHVSRTFPNVPIFIMGHSAGGGMVTAFGALSGPPPSPETLKKVTAIIAQCPLIRITHAPSKVLRIVVSLITKVLPNLPISAPMPEERFSRDPAEVEKLRNDPLRRPNGTTQGLHDMIEQGEELLQTGYQRWPKELPYLMTFGTVDEVNDPVAGPAFFNKLYIKDKKLVEYPDAYHDLMHEAFGIPDKVMEEYFTFIDSHIPAAAAAQA